MLTGENGILTQANTAKEKTERAEIIERAQTDILGKQAENNGDITKNQLKTILEKYFKDVPEVLSDDLSDLELTAKDEYGGHKIKVSDIWSGTTSTGGTLAKDVLKIDSTVTEPKDRSPYVKYNGMNCRVLYNDNTHGLQIITEGNLEENITLGNGDSMVTASDFTYEGDWTIADGIKWAAASYNGAVDNLNKKAKSYKDTKGIAIDARCLGSIPTLASNSKFQDDNSGMWSNNTYAYLEEGSWNNKFKDKDTNYTEDVNQLKALGLNVSSGYTWTWLASRDVYSDSDTTVFFVRAVGSTGNTDLNGLCYVHSNSIPTCISPSNGFRPVFLLSSNVVISGGDGSSENPYVIE